MIHFSSVTSYKSTKWGCVREHGVRELSGPVCKVVGQKRAESRHHRGKSVLGKRERQAGCSCSMKCGLPELADDSAAGVLRMKNLAASRLI